MKLYLPILLFLFSIYACNSSSALQNQEQAFKKMTLEPNEDGEYNIIVFDPQYDVFLKTVAMPQTYYNYEYYRMKNRMYITIWNQRHMMPNVYDPNLYAVSIDLDNQINYGLEFEYKLFNFFRFIEWKYKVRIR